MAEYYYKAKEGKRHFSVFSTNTVSDINVFNENKSCSKDIKPRKSDHTVKLKLRSNSIFAFQNNDFFSNICDDKEISDLLCNGSFHSNIFSNVGDKNFLNNILDDQLSNSNSISINSDIEKNLDFLDQYDSCDELNNAKLNTESNNKKSQYNLDHDVENQDDSGQKSRFSNSTSENYDNVMEVQPDFKEKMDKYAKRLSTEGSTVFNTSQYSTEKVQLQKPINNLQTPHKDYQNNSLNISSGDKSNISYQPYLYYSPQKDKNHFNQSMNNITNFNLNHIDVNPLSLNDFPEKSPLYNINHFNMTANQHKTISQLGALPLRTKSIDFTNSSKNVVPRGINNYENILHHKSNVNINFSNQGNYKANKSLNYFKINGLNLNNSGIVCPPNLDEKYVLDNLLFLLKDQNGCRLVQKKLEGKNYNFDFIINFFELIKNNLVDIINNQFGNYVVQKFIEVIIHDKVLITQFFDKIRKKLYFISVNAYGTRFFQKALEILNEHYQSLETQSLNDVLRELVEGYMYALVMDKNGNHVLQKIMLLYPKDKNDFIYTCLKNYAFTIAKVKQGGCIFKKAFECSNKKQEKLIVYELLQNLKDLINDEYGNFIIQEIIEMKNMEYNGVILDFVTLNIFQLAKKKFSSNVLDKCILLDDNENSFQMRNRIIDHLLQIRLVSDLICDTYGNYVIQKCLQVCHGKRFLEIIHNIKPVLKNLKKNAYGKKIYETLLYNYGAYIDASHNKYKDLGDTRRKSHQ